MNGFLNQMKQRRVYRVAIGYAIAAWLAVQIAATVLPAFHAPEFILRVLIVVLGVGFPVALVLAWAFDVTPIGIEKTPEGTGATAAENLRYVWTLGAIGLLIAAVGVGAYGWWHSPRVKSPDAIATPQNAERSPASDIAEKSIAVLPFENLSDDKSNAYFAEGVQDEILTRLAKVADLKVISRTSTQHFKSSPDNLPQIAKQLGVRNILEGSVQKANDQVRVNVQLINALTDAHLWGDTYDRKLTDIFAVETEIAKAIAESLQAKLTGSEKNSLAQVPTTNPEAYELYLNGKFFAEKRTGEDLRKSIEYFNQAIAKDPNYALAYVGLADSYVLLAAYADVSPRESLPSARSALKKALQLDDTSAEAHASYGLVAMLELDLERSATELQQATELKPNYATAHHWLAWALMTLGRFDPAIAEVKRAVELDPLSLIINADFSRMFFFARRYDEAEAQARKTLEMDSRFSRGHYYLGAALQFKGRLPEAIREFQKALELNHEPFSLAMLGQAYARNRQEQEARNLLAQLNEEAKSHFVAPYAIALVLTGLGEKERAIEELERAYRDRESNFLFIIKVDPILDDLRGNPRFEALAQKVVAPKK